MPRFPRPQGNIILGAFTFFWFLDWITTAIGFEAGLVEVNPLQRWTTIEEFLWRKIGGFLLVLGLQLLLVD